MGFPGAQNPGTLLVPVLPEVTASQVFLGPFERVAEERFSKEWAQDIQEPWKQRHHEAAQRREALEKTEAADAAGTLTVEQQWDRISHTADVAGDAAALPSSANCWRSSQTTPPRIFSTAGFLDEDDPSGIEHLERAMTRDIFATPDACGVIHAYLQRKGRLPEAKAMERRVYEHEQLIEQAQEERTKVNHKSPMLPHGLSEAELAAIRSVLTKSPEIARTFIAKAEVELLPDYAYYLIGITIQVPWWQYRGEERDQGTCRYVIGNPSSAWPILHLHHQGTRGRRPHQGRGTRPRKPSLRTGTKEPYEMSDFSDDERSTSLRRFAGFVVLPGGAAAIGWQLLWQHHAALALGVSAQATALVVATTMIGMTGGALSRHAGYPGFPT